MSMSPPFVAALVAVIACCTSPPLEAEDDVLLDVLQVTATRREMSNLEVSPGVTVVTATELAGHVPVTAVDHLHGEPGTYVQQTTPGQGVPDLPGYDAKPVELRCS